MQETSRARLKRLMSVLIGILLVYGLFVLAIYLGQRRLLYFPRRLPPGPVEESARQLGLQLWPGAADYRGFLKQRGPKPSRLGIVVVTHGNAGSAIDRPYYVTALNALGYDVLIVEYPGYGARPGAHNEPSFVDDLRATIRALRDQEHTPIYLWGESLGCGVAAEAAADPDLKISGLVLLAPWDSLPNLAQRLYWFLPAKWLTKDRYDSVANLAEFTRPAAVLIAEEDEIIPNDLSKRLYESLRCPKRLWTFPGAGHNTWPASPSEAWWREVMDFVTAKDK